MDDTDTPGRLPVAEWLRSDLNLSLTAVGSSEEVMMLTRKEKTVLADD